jgi:hypothetical protein
MADLHRLIAWLVLAVGAWWCTSAQASFPASGGSSAPEYRIDPHEYASQFSAQASWRWFAGSGAACTQFATDFKNYNSGANWATEPTGSVVGSVSTPTDVAPANGNAVGTCREDHQISGNGAGFNTTTLYGRLKPVPYSCPSNSTLAGQTCTCNSGYVQNTANNGCVSVQQATCDLAKSTGVTEWGSTVGKAAMGSTTCMPNGCQGQWTSTVTYTNKTTGISETEGNIAYTGGTCVYNPSAGDTTSSYPDECKGGAYGQVNGINTCIPYDPNKNVVESTKATNQTVTGTVTPSTPGGTGTTSTGTTTTTTTEGTKCDGGQCTTTQNGTKANADGTTTTFTTTTTMTMSDYCKDHPTEELCKAADKGSFTGSCSSGFSCSGDAVQCAQARAAYDLKCTLVDGPNGSSSVEKALYEASAGATGTGIVTSAVALSSSSFDQSNALGVGASCALDKTITVRGTVVTLPFSQVCSSLAMMGNVLLAVGFLLAIRIVGRG